MWRAFLRAPSQPALSCRWHGWALLLSLLTLVGTRAALPAPVSGNTNSSAAGMLLPVKFSHHGPGFSRLEPDRTGIHFTNTLDDRLVMSNNNFLQGSGLALGDYDGDGWCDIYLCAIDGANALYRNLGNWVFEDRTQHAGLACSGWHSTGATFADLDGDGRLDLLVNTLGRGTHSFLNDGDGRFHETTQAAGLTSATGAFGMGLGDVDGDHDLDLYVANYGAQAILRGGGRAQMRQVNGRWEVVGPYANRLRYVHGRLEELGEPDALYLNDGRGHFAPVPWSSNRFLDEQGQPVPVLWEFGLGVQMRDINDDGFPDIYVCNDFRSVDRIWLNDGTGHFHAPPILAMRHQSFASMGVDFADVDRDGRMDFFVVEMLSRAHARRMRQSNEMEPHFPLPGRFLDRPQVARNTFFWNRGDGTYAEIADFSGLDATEWSWQPVFLDVDLDGFEDILVVNGHAFDIQDRDVLAKVRARGPQAPEQSRTNILLYPRLKTPNLAFRNRGDRTFAECGHDWGFDASRICNAIALADLDHDGDLDAVVNGLYSSPLLYRNESTAPRLAVRLRGLPPNTQGIGAKINVTGDRLPPQTQEIISSGRYLAGDDPMRVFAAGAPTNVLRVEVDWPSGRRSVIESVPANAILELDEARATPFHPLPQPIGPTTPFFADVSERLRHIHHEEPYEDYARQPLLMKKFSQAGPGVAWFDLDDDGHEDLFIGSGKGGWPGAFRGDGHGGFAPWNLTDTAAVPDDLTALVGATIGGRRLLLAGLARYESAGRTSGAWTISLGRSDRILRGAPFPEMSLPDPADTCGPVAVADFDGDGDLDVFLGGRLKTGRYPEPASSCLYRQDGGQLISDRANTERLRKSGLVSGAVWSDLNADGFPELVLACAWGPIRIFQNDRGKLTPWNPPVTGPGDRAQPATLDQLTGWWNSVTTADLDGDGQLDLIAGNWGLNSIYHATDQHPVSLYYGDLGGLGVVDLVEAYYAPELDEDVPRRSLAALAHAAPMLSAFFASYQSFSTAPVSQLFEKLRVEPRVVQATHLESLVFFNRADHFDAVPLPAEAQWSPVFAISAADYDGDGNEDLILSQNFFAVRPEMPRLDAGRGLWLRGTGHGRLEPVPGQKSGILVYGEQRGAASCDFNEDGRTDLVVTQNGARTMLLQNVLAKPGLRVRLRGPAGNPDGIGAALRLKFGDRLGPVRELHAGAGYWSQDSAIQVLAEPSAPTALWIRWPGGRVTTRDLDPDVREIVVEPEAEKSAKQPARTRRIGPH